VKGTSLVFSIILREININFPCFDKALISGRFASYMLVHVAKMQHRTHRDVCVSDVRKANNTIPLHADCTD
jgi:hypothetical protein